MENARSQRRGRGGSSTTEAHGVACLDGQGNLEPVNREEVIVLVGRAAREAKVFVKGMQIYCSTEDGGKEISCLIETLDGQAPTLARQLGGLLIGEKRGGLLVCGWRKAPSFDCDGSPGTALGTGCTCNARYPHLKVPSA